MADVQSDRSIRDWMKVFNGLYSVADSKKTPQAVWNAAIGHFNTIGESIRRTTLKKDLLTAAAHAFCWICSFLNRCHPPAEPDSVFSFDGCLSGVVALKYPNICGHCQRRPCICNTQEIDSRADKAAHYEQLLKERSKFKYENLSVSEWQDIFNSIFGNNVHQMTLESIGLHFLEEVGEVVTAMRGLRDLKRILDKRMNGLDVEFLSRLSNVEGIVGTYAGIKSELPPLRTEEEKREFKRQCFLRDEPLIWKWRLVEAKMAMVIEIADTFSWFCSVLNKIRRVSDDNEMKLPSLERRLTDEYFADGKPCCPTCRQPNCSCLFCP